MNRATNNFSPKLSACTNLSQRRYVTAGTRAYIVGLQDGSFRPLGWHIAGEMGGVWAPPMKLLDAVWMQVQHQPLPPATRFHRFPEKVQFDHPLPSQQGWVRRSDFVPDDLPCASFQWQFQNAADAPLKLAVTLAVCFHPLLIYPWARSREERQQNAGAFDFSTMCTFLQQDLCLARVSGHRRAVALQLCPTPAQCTIGSADEAREFTAIHAHPAAVAVVQFHYELNLPAGGEQTLRLAVTGSLSGQEEALHFLERFMQNRQLYQQRKKNAYQKILAYSQLHTPDRLIDRAFQWSKVNLRMATLEVPGLCRGIVAGYPDYPWWFANDGAYSIPALLTVGQFELAKHHLEGIAARSQAVNQGSGKVVHEMISEGTVCFGRNTDPGNTSETAQFAKAVYLTWLWSGDQEFLHKLYPFIKTGLLDWLAGTQMAGGDLPAGYGNDEEPGWGPWRLDVACYAAEAFAALAHMAQHLGDRQAALQAETHARQIGSAIQRNFWLKNKGLYACSLAAETQTPLPPWGSPVPMEAGIAPEPNALRSFERLEQPDFNTEWGYAHPDWLQRFTPMTIATSLMAVAEAKYGRIARGLEYVKKIARHITVEFPGALPEFAPPYPMLESPFWQPNLLQSWGAYGLHWPLVRHVFGLQPNVPEKVLTITPNVPAGWQSMRLKNVRVGQHHIHLTIRQANRFCEISLDDAPADFQLIPGMLVPCGKKVKHLLLNDHPCSFSVEKRWENYILIYIESNAPGIQNFQWRVEFAK